MFESDDQRREFSSELSRNLSGENAAEVDKKLSGPDGRLEIRSLGAAPVGGNKIFSGSSTRTLTQMLICARVCRFRLAHPHHNRDRLLHGEEVKCSRFQASLSRSGCIGVDGYDRANRERLVDLPL